jgi:CheY-like chemotaxis protein
MGKYKFIIIDDSALDCYIAEKMIRYTGQCEDVHCFLGATEALEFIKVSRVSPDDPLTIVILDVLMPIMSGFVFVEEFEKLPQVIKDKYKIIALTSSMNKNDIDKICSYDTVNNIMDKPITAESLSPLLLQ